MKENTVLLPSEESILEKQEYAKAKQIAYRQQLLATVNKIIDDKNWLQKEIALHLGMTQPRASNLRNGNYDKFSTQALQEILTILGYEFCFNFQPSLGRGAHKLTVKVEVKK